MIILWGWLAGAVATWLGQAWLIGRDGARQHREPDELAKARNLVAQHIKTKHHDILGVKYYLNSTTFYELGDDGYPEHPVLRAVTAGSSGRGALGSLVPGVVRVPAGPRPGAAARGDAGAARRGERGAGPDSGRRRVDALTRQP